MKKLLLLLILLVSSAISAQEIAGLWGGILKFQGTSLQFNLNISKDAAGYSATLDIPQQGAQGLPLDFQFKSNEVTFAIPQAGISYKGTFGNNSIKGTFSQAGMNIPLDFEPAKKALRPQEPVKPYPYHEEEVTFKNEKANITLAGTLTLPKKEGNYPAVILITGSGPQNRNEEIMEHKPFLVLADYLTRNGFAVLRYDDRGVGGSGGDFENATTFDFATDTEAALNYLKTRKEINKKKIGLLGHSEGGGIAPLVAEKNTDVAFIVMLAGLGIQGTEQMVLQNYLLGKAGGMPEEELTKLGAMNRKMYNVVIADNTDNARKAAVLDALKKEMGPLFASKGVPQADIDQMIQMQAEGLTSPWYISFLKYDPAPVIERVKCPVLALNGDKDLQVAAAANLDGIKRAAEKGGNKKVTTKVLPNLNHLFQESTTGKIEEYGTIEQTISPSALNEINVWLQKQVK